MKNLWKPTKIDGKSPKRLECPRLSLGTSPNFAAGLGLWGQLRIQSPGAVFREDIDFARYRYLWTPRQSSYRVVHFPICPGTARWLSVMKQFYAVVLLPYVVPAMMLEFLMSLLFCVLDVKLAGRWQEGSQATYIDLLVRETASRNDEEPRGYWVIFQSRLSCLVKCLQVHVLMLLAIFAWLLTFGHFGANGIGKYWTSLWPFVCLEPIADTALLNDFK